MWTNEMRIAARERFWTPLIEMVDMIVSRIDERDTAERIMSDPKSYMDSGIIGARWRSPVCRRAIMKLLRNAIGTEDVEEYQDDREDPEPIWIPQDKGMITAKWYPVLATGHSISHQAIPGYEKPMWTGYLKIDGKIMRYESSEAQGIYARAKKEYEVIQLQNKARWDREMAYEYACRGPRRNHG